MALINCYGSSGICGPTQLYDISDDGMLFPTSFILMSQGNLNPLQNFLMWVPLDCGVVLSLMRIIENFGLGPAALIMVLSVARMLPLTAANMVVYGYQKQPIKNVI